MTKQTAPYRIWPGLQVPLSLAPNYHLQLVGPYRMIPTISLLPESASSSSDKLSEAMKVIMTAKRIVVICGAGISVHAGIPDFRSEEGIFRTPKQNHPRESALSGMGLFSASVYNAENTKAQFHQVIADLFEKVMLAQPTPFHRLLQVLNHQGKLLRVYTQNIDSLEAAAGLSFGLPTSENHAESPMCIPLHGTLRKVECQTCSSTYPTGHHLASLKTGASPFCPNCSELEAIRRAQGKREHSIGTLRPSIVMYDETHRDSAQLGAAIDLDALGKVQGKGKVYPCADLLLVVGTSLKVEGTKRLVRQFSRGIRSRAAEKKHLTAPKALYLNLEFGLQGMWSDVFDVWIEGDAQTFANLLFKKIQDEDGGEEASKKRKGGVQVTDAQTSSKSAKIEAYPASHHPTLPPKCVRKPLGLAPMPLPLKPKIVIRPRQAPITVWRKPILKTSVPQIPRQLIQASRVTRASS